MEPHRQQRADTAIQAFRTQVRTLAAVAESVTAGLERGASGKAEPDTLGLAALVNRLEEISPMLSVLAEELREKATDVFGKPQAGDTTTPVTIHGVRNGLHAITLYASVLNEQLARLGATQKSGQNAPLPVTLEALGAAAQAMGRELAEWSKDIEARLL